MSLENNTRYREQSIRLLFLVVPFAVLFFNIIWLAFDWPGIIKVSSRLSSFFTSSLKFQTLVKNHREAKSQSSATRRKTNLTQNI